MEPQEFSVCNVYLDKDATDVKVEWENKDNCPDKTYSVAKEKCQVIKLISRQEF